MSSRSFNASLDRMPTELLRMTGRHMSRDTLGSVTRVSKRLRIIFLSQLLRTMTFTGDVSEIARDIRSLQEKHPASPSGPLYKYIRFINFILKSPLTLHQSMLSSRSLRTPGTVRDLFREATELQGVSFDFGAAPLIWQEYFIAHLGDASDWPGLSSLCVFRAHPTIYRAIISRSTSEDLKALAVSSYRCYKRLKPRYSHLKRLAVVDFFWVPMGRLRPVKIAGILNDIADNFKHLECLILGNFLNATGYQRQRQFQTEQDSRDLNIMIIKLVMTLKAMPRLVRFAFTLDDATFGSRHFGEGWKPWNTDAGKMTWYTDQVHGISGCVPRLQQLCIRTQPATYIRGIRRSSQPKMAISWQTDMQGTGHGFDQVFV